METAQPYFVLPVDPCFENLSRNARNRENEKKIIARSVVCVCRNVGQKYFSKNLVVSPIVVVVVAAVIAAATNSSDLFITTREREVNEKA